MYSATARSPGNKIAENTTVLILLLAITSILLAAVLSISGKGSSLPGFATLAAIAATTVYTASTLVISARSSTGRTRRFWTVLIFTLVLSSAGTASWYAAQLLGVSAVGLTIQNACFTVSYLLYGGALVWLAGTSARRMGALAVLDGIGVLACTGLLAWYFVLGPAVAGWSLNGPMESFRALGGPMAHGPLLFLSLVVLFSPMRPSFVGWLVASNAILLFSDGVYIVERQLGPLQAGSPAEVGWAIGTLCLGFAARKSIYSDRAGSAKTAEAPRWQAASGAPISKEDGWERLLGPVLPPGLYGLLLLWVVLHPPVPAYVLWVGAGLMVLFVARTVVAGRMAEALRVDRERLVRQAEQQRISEELHDSLKQSVQAIRWLLDSYERARSSSRPEIAEKALSRASQASREASFQVARPVEELRAVSSAPGTCPEKLFGRLLSDFQGCFEVRVQAQLYADAARLSPEGLAAAYRISSEALWNAGRHAQADNVRLSSYGGNGTFTLEVRDDGTGFQVDSNLPDDEISGGGAGLASMRARAAQAGGTLRVTSEPDCGTTIRLRLPMQPVWESDERSPEGRGGRT